MMEGLLRLGAKRERYSLLMPKGRLWVMERRRL